MMSSINNKKIKLICVLNVLQIFLYFEFLPINVSRIRDAKNKTISSITFAILDLNVNFFLVALNMLS